MPLKALEHPRDMRRLLARPADVLHFQWLGAPELDAVLLRPRVPCVLTAHDLLPRRTAHRAGLWQRLFSRFDRVVVHSRRGLDALVELGLPAEQVRVVPHPVFRHEIARRDDGATVLALGVIRPYKGLSDAVSAIARLPHARLLVAGDPRIDLAGFDEQAPGRIDWQLGYLPPERVAEALARATVAVFPYRAELDQSGALLEALGSGVPAVVYDVGGLGEVVRGFDAGRVVAPGDVAGLTTALDELLGDASALAAARLGAERARDELTLGPRRSRPRRALPGADVSFGRRNRRFDELVHRQLDLVEVDQADLLTEAQEAELAWTRADRETAEEAYGDYQLVVDAVADVLLDTRETYAGTLEEETAGDYRRAFNREATRRFRRYSTLLADLDET